MKCDIKLFNLNRSAERIILFEGNMEKLKTSVNSYVNTLENYYISILSKQIVITSTYCHFQITIFSTWCFDWDKNNSILKCSLILFEFIFYPNLQTAQTELRKVYTVMYTVQCIVYTVRCTVKTVVNYCVI